MAAAKKAYGPFQGSIVGRFVRKKTVLPWKLVNERARIILAWLDRNDVWVDVVDEGGHTMEIRLTDVILEGEGW